MPPVAAASALSASVALDTECNSQSRSVTPSTRCIAGTQFPTRQRITRLECFERDLATWKPSADRPAPALYPRSGCKEGSRQQIESIAQSRMIAQLDADGPEGDTSENDGVPAEISANIQWEVQIPNLDQSGAIQYPDIMVYDRDNSSAPIKVIENKLSTTSLPKIQQQLDRYMRSLRGSVAEADPTRRTVDRSVHRRLCRLQHVQQLRHAGLRHLHVLSRVAGDRADEEDDPQAHRHAVHGRRHRRDRHSCGLVGRGRRRDREPDQAVPGHQLPGLGLRRWRQRGWQRGWQREPVVSHVPRCRPTRRRTTSPRPVSCRRWSRGADRDLRGLHRGLWPRARRRHRSGRRDRLFAAFPSPAFAGSVSMATPICERSTGCPTTCRASASPICSRSLSRTSISKHASSRGATARRSRS